MTTGSRDTKERDRREQFDQMFLVSGFAKEEAGWQVLAAMFRDRDIAAQAGSGIILTENGPLEISENYFVSPKQRLGFLAMAELAGNAHHAMDPLDIVSRARRIAKSRGMAVSLDGTFTEMMCKLKEQGTLKGNLDQLRNASMARQLHELFSLGVPDLTPDSIDDIGPIYEQVMAKLKEIQTDFRDDRISFGRDRIGQFASDMEMRKARFDAGLYTPLTWAWKEWDRMILPSTPGKLYTFLMAHGRGKTTYMLCGSEREALMGTGIGFVHMEDDLEDLKNKTRTRWTGIPYNRIVSGDVSAEEMDLIRRVGKVVDEKITPNITFISGAGKTCAQVLRELDRAVDRGKIQKVVIDYMNAFARGWADVKMRVDINQGGGQDAAQLIGWSGARSIPVMVCDQLNKDGEQQMEMTGKIDTTKQFGAAGKQHGSKVILAATRRRLIKEQQFGDRWFGEGEYSPIVELHLAKQNDWKTGVFKQYLAGDTLRVSDLNEAGTGPKEKQGTGIFAGCS